MRTFILLTAVNIIAMGTAGAQPALPQPYAGKQTQEIKSLTAQEIDDLRNGRGMGFALTAELNGYPGPAHILELAGDLQLTSTQKARVQALFDAMKAETSRLGEVLIAQERALDEAFAKRTIDTATLETLTARAGAARANLRAAHLRYHLEAAPLLDEKQTRLYARLRGYSDTPGPQSPGGGHSGHGGRHQRGH